MSPFILSMLLSKALLDTEMGRFSYSGNNIPPEALAMVRPDDTQVVADETGEATVIAREFQGAQNLYTIRLPSGATIRSSQPSSVIFPVGAKVKITPARTRVALFPRGLEESVDKSEWGESPD
ncbi:MAG: TOBE domain-containing protein [Dehalococcoidia bacterium]